MPASADPDPEPRPISLCSARRRLTGPQCSLSLASSSETSVSRASPWPRRRAALPTPSVCAMPSRRGKYLASLSPGPRTPHRSGARSAFPSCWSCNRVSARRCRRCRHSPGSQSGSWPRCACAASRARLRAGVVVALGIVAKLILAEERASLSSALERHVGADTHPLNGCYVLHGAVG